MEVYLSRNHQTCLHLFPLSVGRFQDVFDQPNGPDGQPPHFVISRFVSPVESLDRNLKDVVIRDLSGLSQLNALVEAVERISGRDLQIFSGVLDLEPIRSPADALRVSQQMERYERIDGAATEEKLGRWLVEREQSDIYFPEEVRPYLDYAAIGSHYVKQERRLEDMVSYAPLWRTMEKCSATTYTLQVKGGISSSTIRRLKAGDSVSTNTLDALCKILNCTIQDIVEYLPE